MSVELSNRLRESLGCSLPATLAFEQPTLERWWISRRTVLKLGAGAGAPPGRRWKNRRARDYSLTSTS